VKYITVQRVQGGKLVKMNMSFGQEGLRALYVFGRQRRGIKCLAANKEAPGQLYGGKYLMEGGAGYAT